jgi:hypothetical protein
MAYNLYKRQMELEKLGRTQDYNYGLEQFANQRTDMNRGIVNDAASRGDARGSYAADFGAEQNRRLDLNVGALKNNFQNYLSGYQLRLQQLRGGGGGSRSRYPALPRPTNNPNAVAQSPSLNQAVQSGTVPLEAARAYTGTPRPQAAAAVKPRNPYDWWRDNH